MGIKDIRRISKEFREYQLMHNELSERQVDEAAKSRCNDWIKEFHLKGGGGTDFRPVFSYVRELRRNKKVKKPAGLLYFTDGLGRYPEKAPDYKTAFLFLRDYDRNRVPSWCINFQIDERELR